MKSLRAMAVVACAWLISCSAGERAKGGLVATVGLSQSQVSKSLGARRLALLVGITQFEDESWPGLKHARNDARELGRLLTDVQLGRFDAVEVLAATGGSSLAQVEAALDRLTAQNTSPHDTVLVYFSTHGTLVRGPAGSLTRYLVTSDTDQKRIRATALPVRSLMQRFERLPSQRKVLVLASCHSGSGKSALPRELSRELAGIKGAFFVQPLAERSQASMVLAACAWGETAREDDQLGHDIYTHFLLEALAGKDQDGDGAITATEAHAYAMEKTYYFSKGRQRPQVESSVLGTDPVVLSGRRLRPADPVLYSFLPHLQGLQIQIDGRDKGVLPARLVLTPGQHRLVVRDSEGRAPLLDRQLEVAAGDRLAVEELMESARDRFHASISAGYQWFLDADTRRSLVAPTPALGLVLAYRDFPMKNLETSLDLLVGGSRQELNIGGLTVRQDLLEIAYGLRVLYRIELDPLELFVGPRMAGVHLLRHQMSEGVANQSYFNFSPGLVARLHWQLWTAVSLDLEARIHFYAVHTEKENLNQGYLDFLGGVGFSF